MSRDSKFLASALAIAALSLAYLEIARVNAQEAPSAARPASAGTVPMASLPGVASRVPILRLTSDKGLLVIPRQNLRLELLLDAQQELRGLSYHAVRPGGARGRDYIFPLERIQQGAMLGGVEGHELMTLRTLDDFSAREGGRMVLRYLYRLGDSQAGIADQHSSIELELSKHGEGWIVHVPGKPDHPIAELAVKMMDDFERKQVGIDRIDLVPAN
jgi:hypothetical protein